MQKILHAVLDFLLIFGALLSILTIDGGKWLISNPAFYQSGSAEWYNTAPVRAEENAAVVSTPEDNPQADAACDTISTPTNLNGDAPFSSEMEAEQPAPLAVACE